MIHFDSCFLLEGCQDPHRNVLECLKWVHPESVAVVSLAELRTGAVHRAGAKACSHPCWASQLPSGAFPEVVKGEICVWHIEDSKNVHWRRGISDIWSFKALPWRCIVTVVVHRSVADEALRTETQIHF